ncbi:hypothetical protein BFW01_g132 [Lasiodiplodia theobromae]|uniref:Uncharacterized protein n=1 Tax=Lasiodiplodia theobromae TaxID=45133 RepID=A0A8H7IQY4_9PEZI|nr:uncharacterized protein LTHEOB_2792 [Lasiodiplodia theobromae]KAF4534817.1 hypothetical protein LTHEOB_2792 [Lasiodiplodia theobromae]KAF9629951.1 hypothetical protein BFW01_g132 [Lasiodiplodia theobromae]
MASLDITIDAVKGLSDADKTRLVVAYLHGNDRGNVDWQTAASFTGSKTANSFRTNVYKVINRLTDASKSGSAGGEASSIGASKKRMIQADDGDEAADVGANKKGGNKKRRLKKQAAKKEDLEVNEV